MNKACRENAECYNENDYFADKQEKLDRFFRKIEKIGWRIGFKLNQRTLKIIGLSLMAVLVITAGSFYLFKSIAKGAFRKK